MRVYGIDFTSKPSRAKPLTRAVCELHKNTLTVREIRSLLTFEALERSLEEVGPWITALDFPFAQPRKLIVNLDWPRSWEEYIQVVESMTKLEFEELLRKYQDQRPMGDKRDFRAVDERAGSCSPMQLHFIPVAKMFFEGAKRLLRSKATVVPFAWRNDNAGTVVEGYPALVARRWIGREKYKTDNKKKQTPQMQENRRALVTGIQLCQSSGVYGFEVRFVDRLAQNCIEDGTGDRLDAVLCAMQAAWAYLKRSENYGVPAGCDLLEGWIVDPSLQLTCW